MSRRIARKIAAHYALTTSGLVPWPVVTLDDGGTIVSIEECAGGGIDSRWGVEFYSGVLTARGGGALEAGRRQEVVVNPGIDDMTTL